MLEPILISKASIKYIARFTSVVSLDQVPCDSFLGRMDPQAVMVHRTYAVERSFFQLLDFHWKENLLCVLRRERFPFLFLDGNHFLLLKLGSRRHSVEYFSRISVK